MAPVAQLLGRVGRLSGQHPPNEHGLTLSIRVLPASGQGSTRATACALTSDTLGLVTDAGQVYAVHLTRQRYTCLDTLTAACSTAAFMVRLSRRLFVGCKDGSLHCYDLTSSTRLAQLPGHRTALVSLSTKPDTEQLLSASQDAVLLWDMATFRQRRMLGSATYGSSHAVFSPDGNIIAAAAPSGTITLWDAKSLRELGKLQAPTGLQQQRFSISSVSISPDGCWLLAGCMAPALLLLYDMQQQALSCGLHLPRDMFGISQVQMLPDSCSAAVLTSDGCISFVDVTACCFSAQLQLTFPGCRATNFSTDLRANSMAVVCTDGLVRLYDLGVVRAKQQGVSLNPQLQKLQESQLSQLSATSEALPVPAPAASGVQHIGAVASSSGGATAPAAGQQQQAGRRELGDVGNIPSSSQAGARSKGGRGGSSNVKPGSTTAEQLTVRQLAAPAAALNRRKLQEMLLMFGEFPARYRRLIWEHLLQLPRNSQAFALLQDQGMHPAFKDLPQRLQLPGSSRSSLGVRLQASLSQLAHWCPLFGEVGFLPSFAFPFVKLFGPKAESAFETLATLLTNWCKGWFELFPNPPLPLLRRFLLLVSHHDRELGSHLQQLGVPLLEALWEQLSGALSDLLPDAGDWLVLWDHCLAAPSGPGFIYQLLASYLITTRQQLLAAHDQQQLTRMFEARPAVDVRKMVALAHRLRDATPGYAALGLRALGPLPAGGAYPVFSEYPTGSVEAQQHERQAIQEAEEALIRRRQVVAELQQRSQQVAYEAAALTSQRQQLAALDAQRRAAIRSIEDSLATAGSRLDDRAKEEKLRQIRIADEAYQASLASLRAEWSAELSGLKADLDHKRRLAAAQLKARQEEEDVKALEFQAQQRLFALQQEELAAAGSSALQDAAAAQASMLAAQLQRKTAEWQAEDEARALRLQHEQARKARLTAAAEKEAALQAAKGVLLAQELQTQEELAKVEHMRRLRQLAEEEADLTAQQLQLQAERQAVAAAAGMQNVQEAAQAQLARFEQQQQVRMAVIAAERGALQQQLSQLHLAAAELGSAARLSQAEQQQEALSAALQQADQEHAARVAAIMDKLQGAAPSAAPAQTAAPGRPATAAGLQATVVSAAVPTSFVRAAATSAANTAGIAAAAGEPSATQRQQQALGVAGGSLQHSRQAAASLEAVEQRLAAIQQRKAALDELYGVQVDAEVQQLLERRQQQAQAQAANQEELLGVTAAAAVPDAGRSPAAAPWPPVPTSEASAGSGSSGVSSQHRGSGSSSAGISSELEELLAEAEAEVQHELAMARAHLAGGSQLYPYSSTGGTPQSRQLPSLQSGVGGWGRGRSAAAAQSSAAQRTTTVSTGVAGGVAGTPTGGWAAMTAAGGAGLMSGSGSVLGGDRLKPVLEEPPPQADSKAAAGGGGSPGPAAGGEGTAKPADSSSSSSSSPERRGEAGSKDKEKKKDKAKAKGQEGGEAIAAAQAASTTAAAGSAAAGSGATGLGRQSSAAGSAGPQLVPAASRQQTAAADSSSSHGSGVGRHMQQAAAEEQQASPPTHFSSPGSTFSMATASSREGPAVTSHMQSGALAFPAAAGGGSGTAAVGAGLYQPVLLQGAAAPPGARASASTDTERLLAALVGPAGSPPDSATVSGSSSVSKPSSLSFDVPAPGAGSAALSAPDTTITPVLGTRSRARTGVGSTSAAPARTGSQGGGSSGTGSSVQASLHTAGGDEEHEGDAADSGPASSEGSQGNRPTSGRASRGLEPSGRVSSELRRSSSATSEELDNLLQQLSQYEAHLLHEASSYGTLPAELAPQQQQASPGRASQAATSPGSSVSWSQTLANLRHMIPRETSD